MKKRNLVFPVLFLFLLWACNSDYPYRPRGYYKIALPQKSYQQFDRPGFPYTFEYPTYARIIQDTAFFEQKPENPYWINVDLPQFAARIHLSYKEIGRNKLDSLVNDAFTLSYKQHTYKASAIEPEPFTTPNGSSGVYFSLRGNTATANQFFITDSVKHFLRGALYFAATPNEDSLRPVNDFLKADVQHLINTLQWR
jgi:gliding motility-associated lipoprotein GldD